MAAQTVPDYTPTKEREAHELRTLRGMLLGKATILDRIEAREAVHYLRTALTSLDDCIDALEAPEQPTTNMRRWEPAIADDVRMDRLADADRSDYV